MTATALVAASRIRAVEASHARLAETEHTIPIHSFIDPLPLSEFARRDQMSIPHDALARMRGRNGMKWNSDWIDYNHSLGI